MPQDALDGRPADVASCPRHTRYVTAHPLPSSVDDPPYFAVETVDRPHPLLPLPSPHGARSDRGVVERVVASRGRRHGRGRRRTGGSRIRRPVVLGWARPRALAPIRAAVGRHQDCGRGERHREHLAGWGIRCVPGPWAALDTRYPGRFLLGLGASHAPLAEDYSRPYSHMVSYLDALDADENPVAPDRRVLAALRPRMLDLARDRSRGAHPYFVPAAHTAWARRRPSVIGPLLAPEVAVVLETDPVEVRGWRGPSRQSTSPLPNYTQQSAADSASTTRHGRRWRSDRLDRRRHALG